RAKVGRALEHEELVRIVRLVDRRAHAEARVPGLVLVAQGRRFDLRSVLEKIVFEQHAPPDTGDDEVYVHGRVEDEARVEQVERERAVLMRPDRRAPLES